MDTRTEPVLPEVLVEDVEYVRHAEGSLLARPYLPPGPGPFPLLADVHGGAWCRGTRLDEDRLNRALARRGIGRTLRPQQAGRTLDRRGDRGDPALCPRPVQQHRRSHPDANPRRQE